MWVWRAWTGGDFCHARQGSLGRILRVEAMIEAGAMDEHEPHELSLRGATGAQVQDLGAAPRSKLSMRIMRPPQQAHGAGCGGSSAGASGATSAGAVGGGATFKSARALAMFSTRPPLARRP